MTFDADVEVSKDGRSVHVTCWGAGGPAILLEAGYPSAGLQQFAGAGTMLRLLAAERRVCAYDRAGNGRSDPAPNEPRDLDDVTDDLHAVLEGAGLDTPVALVGSSGGGNIVAYYAHRFPKDVLAVVLLDVPAPQADLTVEQAPEIAWDAPENPEHVDIVPEVENRQANERLPFPAPLLVVTATEGQSNVADQSFWLPWSTTRSRQVELPGPHEVYLGSPQEIATAILALPELGA
jgi:pimeloyl-ACP methyl ester carboxylesterase